MKDLAEQLRDYIESIPAVRRLYPDLYVGELRALINSEKIN